MCLISSAICWATFYVAYRLLEVLSIQNRSIRLTASAVLAIVATVAFVVVCSPY